MSVPLTRFADIVLFSYWLGFHQHIHLPCYASSTSGWLQFSLWCSPERKGSVLLLGSALLLEILCYFHKTQGTKCLLQPRTWHSRWCFVHTYCRNSGSLDFQMHTDELNSFPDSSALIVLQQVLTLACGNAAPPPDSSCHDMRVEWTSSPLCQVCGWTVLKESSSQAECMTCSLSAPHLAWCWMKIWRATI